MDFKMSPFFHRPDDILLDEFWNNLRPIVGMSCDAGFMNPDIHPDAERDDNDENQARDEDDFEK